MTYHDVFHDSTKKAEMKVYRTVRSESQTVYSEVQFLQAINDHDSVVG